MRNRIDEIKEKGFNIITPRDANQTQQTGYQGLPATDFKKIKIGAKTLDDAVAKVDANFAVKEKEILEI